MKRKVSPGICIAIILLAVGILGCLAGSGFVLVTTKKPAIQVSESQKKTDDTTASDDSEDYYNSEEQEFDAIDGFKITTTSSEKGETASNEEEKFAFPDSDTEALTTEDVESLESEEDVRDAINYIYAKAGRIFKDETIQAYYEKQDWYEGLYDADEMDADIENYLTDVQYDNIELLTERRSELKENGGE